MGSIVETAVPRRSAELPPPCPSKDVPNDLSFLFAASSLIVMFAASSTRSLAVNSLRSFVIVSSNYACIAAIRAFSSSISETPFTHTHTGVYATRAAGLKTHLPERDFCHPCLGSDFTQQGHAEKQSHTPERQDLKLTSAKLHTKTHGTCLLYQRLASPHDIVSGCWGVP